MSAKLAGLPRAELETLAAYGRDAVALRDALAQRGRTVLSEALDGAAQVYHWRHYPEGDVYDPATHAQYFYHAHPPESRAVEHGHFHAFLRAGAIPSRIHPLVMPELAIAGHPAAPPQEAPSAPAPAGDEGDAWTHLVAISMDRAGKPLRLFTTNRWVTGETWHAGSDVASLLDRFAVGQGEGAAPLDRWLTAMVQFYRPTIAALLAARDAAVMDFRRKRRAKVHVLEDRRLEVVSTAAIDLDADLRRVEAALKRVA